MTPHPVCQMMLFNNYFDAWKEMPINYNFKSDDRRMSLPKLDRAKVMDEKLKSITYDPNNETVALDFKDGTVERFRSVLAIVNLNEPWR